MLATSQASHRLVQSAKCVKLFHMTELTEPSAPPTTDDALPLGPQSLVWRYFGDNRMFLIGPRPAVLQNMLAELGQGVLDHSVFFSDTAARVKRSLPPIFRTVYGSDGDHVHPANAVARSIGTVTSDLLCAVAQRVPRIYVS